ncbi:small subunit processome component 20-like protein [Micractinium conductrix]|uniref:Small subunit processome component 20-like protein n=1 Tax=Micractinium conductrix TaxID=554055 RepID=A0A2P6VR64_9CHLO|nr:small subunit processome component 20-like protein [Micractinium conductrix]|eukprot:PSC76593.1 small subunit processome component 20-like protein [Micractinium conductrix]
MLDSSDDEQAPQPRPVKRFKYRTFAERVAHVDVDVYRSLGPKRAEPLAGCSSFFQEGLAKWKELNSAEHWLAAAAELAPLCQSLPQLVHHAGQIVHSVLLPRLRVAFALSLEPLLELTGTLARDLQADFLPLLDPVLAALADLVDEGLDREPELLQHLFGCVSLVCKHLVKLLTGEARLLGVLRSTQRLRHHRAHHVRVLAAESLGFLLRQAPGPAVRIGIKAVLAEAVSKPTDDRVHAAGALLAEAVTGVSHGLHSRVAALLGPLLREDVLRQEDFKSAKSQSGGRLSADQIQARVAAAASVCIEQLAEHTRRGKVGELWTLLLGEVEARVERLAEAEQRVAAADGAAADAPPATASKRARRGGKAGKVAAAEAPAGGEGAAAAAEELAAARARAARALALLAQLVEHGRGCRVEDYQPLFQLAARLARLDWPASTPSGGSSSGGAGAEGGEAPIQVPSLLRGGSSDYEDFLQPSLSAQVLRLLLALALAHARAAGASEGPAALGKAAPAWALALARAPPAELIAFTRALISPPGGQPVARPFAQQLLGALGRCLLAGELTQLCWPLVADVCATLRPEAAAGAAGVPLILTASGVGAQLAALVRSKLQTFSSDDGEVAAAEAWAALACLPHAAESAAQAAACCAALAEATAPPEGHEGEWSGALLTLHCGAMGAQATLLGAAGGEGGEAVAWHLLPQALALLARHPGSYHAVAAAAAVLQQAAAAGAELSTAQLQELAPLLAPNLSAASQPLRRETLRALCCFAQPPMLATAGSEDAAKGTPQQPCDALQQLLALESRQQGADGGRPAVVSLGRMRNYLEYRRLPGWMVPLVIHELLGVLFIRFAALWNPAHDALAMALDSFPSLAWPLLHAQLAAAQEAFLAGDCYARPEPGAAAAALAAAGGAPVAAAQPLVLSERFAAAVARGDVVAAGGATDAAVRLTHLLKAMAAANNNTVESKSRDWVQLFLAFTDANAGGSEEDGGDAAAPAADEEAESEEEAEEEKEGAGGERRGVVASGVVSGRAWRSGLREWLALLGGLKGARGMYQWEAVQRAVAVQLMDVDPAVQQGALKCLKVFKLKFLLPYLDRLLRLADNKTLRAELTAFPLGVSTTTLRDDEGGTALLAEHRQGVVPLLIRLLYPKMRKRSGRLGGKGAPGSARTAILNFLAAAEPGELRPLLELFLAPLSAAFIRPAAGSADAAAVEAALAQDDPDRHRLVQGPWWGGALGRQPGAWWLQHIDADRLNEEPLRRRVGYLNTLDDLLKHLGHRMQMYLPELLALAVCLLEGGVQPLLAPGGGDDGAASELAEGAKEVRARSLRLVAAVLERFPSSCDYGFLWPRLLAALGPLLPRLPAESAADRAPPLLELVAALAASHHLAPVLADGCSTQFPSGSYGSGAGSTAAPSLDPPAEAAPCAEPWAEQQHLGSGLLAAAVGALAALRCSEPSRVAMLGALESLFDLPDPLPQQLLGPHMPALLAGLQSIVVAVWQQGVGGNRPARGRRGAAAKGSGKPTGPRGATAGRALSILELVGSRVASWEAAQQLTDALLPLLQPREGGGARRRGRRGDELLVARTLAVLAALWSRLPADELPQRPTARQQLAAVAAALAPLAGSLADRNSRQALCAAYSAVAGLLTDLGGSAELLADLNAVSTTEIDEMDYEKRMAAYACLTPDAWAAMAARQAAPLLHTCLHDLRNADDLALRHAASQALARFIEGAAAATDAAGGATACAATPPDSLLAATQRLLFPQLKRGLPAPNIAVRQEHLALLRQLVLAFPAQYAELEVLTDKDTEVDFLLNVGHIQLHRRARALARLTKLLRHSGDNGPAAPPLGVGALVGVVQPLLLQMIVEGKGGEETGGHEAKQADKDRGAGVTDAAVVALGAVAGALPWMQYQQLLGQHLRLMKRHADDDSSKALIRSVCVILDAFHFPLPTDADAEAAHAALPAGVLQPPKQQQQQAAEPMEVDGAAVPAAATGAGEAAEEGAGEAADADAEAAEEEEEEAMEVVEGSGSRSAAAAVPTGDVYRLLSKRVVPELQRIMVEKDTVRAPVALAVVKVLQLLPAAAMRFHLPRTLQKVANLLRGRMQSTRDSARTVLVNMTKQLGADYLPFVCEVLQSACPARGYTAHVLGYTVHAVVEAVVAVGEPGCLDDSLLLILPLMEADLFGEVAEAKEASEFAAAYKEAKKCRGYETYLLLAKVITFGERIPELLTTVQSRLAEASLPKTRGKLATLLVHAARGVLANPTATPDDLCMFFFATADSGLAAEEAARDKAKAAAGAAVPSGRDGADESRAVALHQHLLVEFALTLLHGALRKGLINPRAPGAAELLDPLLPLLVRALRSRHAPSVTSALQSLALLMQSPLPGLAKTAADAGKAVTDLLKRCPKTSHPIAQDCFKLLGGMLRQCQHWQPSPGQLRFLLTWAFSDLEEGAGRQNAFHLLKAILARKLVMPEVYDLMNRVQELMVRSQAAPVRAACSSALLQFLLDYPLGEKRLQEHLQFLLTNAGYEHESGREAALDMLTVVLTKFPEALVSQWAEMIFLPLVARLVNDPSSKCRAMVGAALAVLLRRASAPRRDRLVQYCQQWLAGGDARLNRAAAQSLGIMAEVEGAGFARRVPAVLPLLGDLLASRAETDAAAAEAAADAAPGEGDDLLSAAPGWQEAYYCLLLLQRLLECAAAQLAWATGAPAQRCWSGAQALLLHRHQWVRKASGRLVGAGLAAPGVGAPWLEASGAGAAGALALSFFRQLDSEAADEALAGQSVKCLVFLCTHMHDDDDAAGKLPLPLRPSGGSVGGAANGGAANGDAAANGAAAEHEEEEEEEKLQEEPAGGSEGEEEEEEGGSGDEEEVAADADEVAAEASAAEEAAAGSLTLRGLVRRMVRVAEDKTFAKQMQRGAALRFIAAVASRLGAERAQPFLPLLMRPLYRITEPGAAGNPPEVTSLADEIVAHLRTLVGADAMLAAYNQAREAVRRQRGERKRKAALQTLVDPEAAAKRRIRKQQRKAVGRKKQLDHVRRLRSAGVVVKNKKQDDRRGGGGRGGGGGGRGGRGRRD